MSCRRAHEIDVEEFLLDGGAPHFDEFRAHYPTCSACSEQVNRWAMLEDALRHEFEPELALDDGHPTPAELAGYARNTSRDGDASAAIAGHVDRCAACRNEAALLRAFDPAALRAATGAEIPSASPAPEQASLLDGLRAWLTLVAEALFEPGPARWAAPAMIVVVATIGILALRSTTPSQQPESPQVVKSEAVSPEASPILPPEEPPRLAQRDVVPEPDEPEALPDLAPPDEPNPRPKIEIAEAPVAPAPAPVEKRSDPTTPRAPSEPEPSREVILLASLDALPPAYQARADGRVDWMTRFGEVRATTPADTPKISALAPRDHVGESLDRSPRLWWRIDRPSDNDVIVTITTADAIDPVLEKTIAAPLTAGEHVIDLAAEGVTLTPGVDYRWLLALELDADRPSRNPIVTGALRVLLLDDPRRADLNALPDAERGHALAAAGIWYDAYDFFATLAESHPTSKAATYRDALTESLRTAP